MCVPDLLVAGRQIVERYLLGRGSPVGGVKRDGDDVLVQVGMVTWRVSPSSLRFATETPPYHLVDVSLDIRSDPPSEPRVFAIVQAEIFYLDLEAEVRAFWARVGDRLTRGEIAEVVGCHQGTNPTSRVLFAAGELAELVGVVPGTERLRFTSELTSPAMPGDPIRFCTWFMAEGSDGVARGNVEQWRLEVTPDGLGWQHDIVMPDISLHDRHRPS